MANAKADVVAKSKEAVLRALGAANPLRAMTFTLTWKQSSKQEDVKTGMIKNVDSTHWAGIPGRHYGLIGDAIWKDRIKLEIHPTLLAAALFNPYPVPRRLGGTIISPHTLAVSRVLTSSPADRSLILHEATHAICDLQGRGGMNGLFSEMLAFVAEGIFWRKAMGRAKGTHRAYEFADKIARSILSYNQMPKTEDLDDLATNIKSHEVYKYFAHSEVQYDGIPF